MSIQAPPNLNPAALDRLLAAGINDWGGVSPVTPDHVNPEAPWPQLEVLRRATEAAGKELVARLAIYPRFVQQPERWLAPAMRTPVLDHSDAEGFAREDGWIAGAPVGPRRHGRRPRTPPQLGAAGDPAPRPGRPTLDEAEVVRLFAARGREVAEVCESADALRREVNGERVGYVVNRNINYTNICYFRCRFCAFSKGKLAEHLRGRPYDLDQGEIARRTAEAWQRGATEMCLQGGIHPDYTGATYLEICRTVKQAAPDIHVHAFSPLEVWQGAKTLGMPLGDFLAELQRAGPGLAARHGRGNPRRRGAPTHLPGQDRHRAVARGDGDRPCARACAAPRPSCSAMSTGRATGPGTCCASARCRRAPAASPSSCRCRSCTWRRRST